MLRAVIDTNLLVRYLLTRGPTLAQLISLWENERFVYLTSPAILDELCDVLQRPSLRVRFRVDPQLLLDLVRAETTQTSGKLVVSGVCRDPKDEIFLACAVEGRADYLVTGDKDLLDLGDYAAVPIIRPEVFVALFDAPAHAATVQEVP